jgi:hypothetical protein
VSGPGVCYGYEPRSELSFLYLRDGTGEPLAVTPDDARDEPDHDPLVRWEPPRHPLDARLYEQDGTYRLWIDGGGWFGVDPARPAVQVPRHGDPVRREERLWGMPAALCFLRRGDLPMHAAAVDVGGAAVVFGGPSRFGKTTLAAAFLRAGFRVLAEDLTCCRVSPEPAIVPGPALLRVRRDIASRLEVPGVHAVGEDEERVHLALDGALRGDGAPVPLRAVVLLRPDSEFSLERAPAAATLADLWALSMALPTDADRARCFGQLAALSSTVPLWNLRRPMELGDLDRLVGRLVETCLGS